MAWGSDIEGGIMDGEGGGCTDGRDEEDEEERDAWTSTGCKVEVIEVGGGRG